MDYKDLNKNAACAIILYKENKVLLQLRDNNAPTAKNKWSFFGGGIETNESPKEAVFRETKEELDYNLKNPMLVMVRDLQGHPNFNKEFIFLEEYDGSKLTLGEGADLKFYSKDQIKAIDMVENKRVLMPVIFNYIDFIKS